MSNSGTAVAVSLRNKRQLSIAQRALWASQLAHPTEPVQNMALVSHLDGPVDPHRLADAFAKVVATSDVLRTRITDASVHLIAPNDMPATEIIPLDRSEVAKWAADRCSVPLDMTECGLDSVVLAHPDGTASWFLNLHHVLTDATSSSLVFAATAEAYSSGEAPKAGSYYEWSTESAADQSAATERASRYWHDRETAPRIGRLYRAPDRSTGVAERIPVTPSSDLYARAASRLQSDYKMLTDQLAWSTLLVTTTALYLNRITGADRFAIGLPIHNRTGAEQRYLIGPLMEVFPVDIAVEPDDTARTLHKRIARSVLTTLGNAAVGTAPPADYETVVNVIPQVTQDRFGSFAASTQWVHAGAIDGSHLARIQMTAYNRSPHRSTNADPAQDAPWDFALDLTCGAADRDHLERAGDHYLTVLDHLVTDPDQPIAAWGLCSEEELATISTWGTGPALSGPHSGPVMDLRNALVDNEAIVLEDDTLAFTGSELWAWVGSTARWLQSRGLGPGDRVGIDMGRSAETVVAILATLIAGGSFVPLDNTQPAARRNRLVERARCRLVIDDPAPITAARSTPQPERTELTDPVSFVPVADDPDAEAYVIFTSGSTGEPKGVPITRGGLHRYLQFALARYTGGRRPKTVAPLFSPLTFDLTITTLFVPFLAGGKMIVIRDDGPKGLAEIARRTEITWCKATPSHLEILVRLLPIDHRLCTLVVGGEAFPSRLAADLLAGNSEREIHNEYGPTEAVVGCMDYVAEPELVATQPEVPIGKPAPGVHLAIVDRHLHPVPMGAPGELLISSPGVTAGYLDQSEQSETADPFVELDGRRWYRSGDLVRLQDAERLVYLGRRDEQVKVGGIRLEPTEVETALGAHPAIERAAVRVWSPSTSDPGAHCVRCGLPDNVPGVGFDEHGVCDTCHSYDQVAPVAAQWFRTPDDLTPVRDRARGRRTGSYDCLHLLSGGKDSTYALYQLVERGFTPYSLTLDNGFISDEAKANVARSVADLGIDHEFVTVEAMNDIFRDSLDRYSNVCHGCYKTIYTVAINRADELGIPLIVTGLSRGQLFETRLIPRQFDADRFDPDAIDRALLEARKIYHRSDDAPNRLLDTDLFADDDVFDRIEFLDFYRYLDVELAEMLRFLEQRAPWVRPKDTGRSTNCLINAAGIHTHKVEQGYHNYAVPYAWDVRLGHKTRDEAIDELDDRLDLAEVSSMLNDVGYSPRPRRLLTAWLKIVPGRSMPAPSALREFLAQSLPTYAIPAAFVEVDELPLTANGKLDTKALPAPERVHRSGPNLATPATTATEATVIDLWESALKIEPIGLDDDFFTLGGDSLAALQMSVSLGDRTGLALDDDIAFLHTTPRALAEALDLLSTGSAASFEELGPIEVAASQVGEPERSDGELAVLFDQTKRSDDIMYNIGRMYVVAGRVEADAFVAALHDFAARHQPLSWTYSTPRRKLEPHDAVDYVIATEPIDPEQLEAQLDPIHRQRFDLDSGPRLRCVIQPLTNGHTAIVLVIHHVSGDAASFDRLWHHIDRKLSGDQAPDLPVDYAGFGAWQRQRREGPWGEAARAHWLAQAGQDGPIATLAIQAPDPSTGSSQTHPDGFLTRPVNVAPEQLRAATHRSTASAVIGSLAAVLGCYHDGGDLELGLIASTRDHPTAENLFGYFLNTVPLRLPVDHPDRPLGLEDLAAAASSAIASALAYRSYPLAQIAADRRAAGLPSPSLDVLVSYDDLSDLRFAGAPVTQKVLWNGSAVAPLTFFAEAREDHIDLSVEFMGSRIPARLAEDLLAAWETVLVEAAHNPSAPAWVTASNALADRNALSVLNGPAPDDHALVGQRIAEHLGSAERASKIAVECGDRSLSWGELGRRSTQLAARLTYAGVGRGDRVVVALDRSPELVVALVAIGSLAASYVPIDPSHPASRQRQAAESSQASLALVSSPDGVDRFPQALVIDADGVDHQPWDSATTSFDAEHHGESATPNLSADDEAYVIFTSGTTGVPRGVPVNAGRLTASTGARSQVYGHAPERFLMPSSPAFDSSIVGLYWTLSCGGTVVLPTEAQTHDIDALVNLLGTVDHALLVPTLYRGLLDRSGGLSPQWPSQVIVAGEACPSSLVADHYRLYPKSRLTNEYGPTEGTVWATAHHCSPTDDPIPLGNPVPAR